jgi:hypothetical protein
MIGSPSAQRLSLVLALAVFLIEPAASAYVLPAESILSSVARRRAQLAFKSLILEGIHKNGSDAPEEDVYEIIRPNTAHRIEFKASDGTTVVLTVGTRRWRFKEGDHPSAPLKIKPDVIGTFITSTEEDPGGRRAVALTKAYNIDDNVVSLSRLGHRVAYVIGAKPWEKEKPQIWIDKSLRVPIRLIEVDPKTKSITDTRYLEYGSGQTGEWYPRRIEIWKDGQLVETTVYNNARVNEALNEALLKPPSS